MLRWLHRTFKISIRGSFGLLEGWGLLVYSTMKCKTNQNSWKVFMLYIKWKVLMSTIRLYIFWPIQKSSSTKLKSEKAGIQYIGVAQWVLLLDLTANTNLSPIGRGFDLKSLTFGPWNWGQGQRKISWAHLALMHDKKSTCVLPANPCCTVYVNCPPPPVLHNLPF